MDILDFYRGKISIRKLVMMLRHLPGDSALVCRGYAGDDRWGPVPELLACVADYVYLLDFHYLKSKGTKNMGELHFIERPDMSLKI